jgi:hypothetical protein
MATFFVQRFHPMLGTDRKALAGGNDRIDRVFLHQGALDKACGICCLTMALILLGVASHAEAVRLLGSHNAALRRLRRWTRAVFVEGMSEDDIVEAVTAATLEIVAVRGESGNHRACLAHATRALRLGRVVAIGIASRNWAFHHWILGVGLEGIEGERQRFKPTAILCLDPSVYASPSYRYNARLFLTIPRPGARYLLYGSSPTSRTRVTVSNAVAFSRRSSYA